MNLIHSVITMKMMIVMCISKKIGVLLNVLVLFADVVVVPDPRKMGKGGRHRGDSRCGYKYRWVIPHGCGGN